MLVPLGTASAGFFSFLGNETSLANAEETPRTYLSQSTNVLVATLNPETIAGKGGGDITIDNDALVPSGSSDVNVLGETKPSSDQIARYIVRKGDTLSGIAKMFGVSVNTIRWSNNIASGSTIRIGQELVILPIEGVRYTIKKGDTLASVAKKFKGDVTEIRNFNDLAVNETLSVGDEIIIPDGIVTTPSIPKSTTRNNSAKYSGPEIVGYFQRPLASNCPKTQGIHGNNGIDIGCSRGTTIMAAASGEVIIARGSGWNGGYGQMVVISHPNGTQTLYGHMSAISVNAGDLVSAGQKIGEVGNTGNSTGPHLHLEVRGAKNPF